MHEVYRPHSVNRLRYRQLLWLRSVRTLLRLYPKIQLQFLINPVHAFMVPEKFLYVAQKQEAKTKAPVPLILRQPKQQLGDLSVLRIEFWADSNIHFRSGRSFRLPIWPPRVGEMALKFFRERLRNVIGLELCLDVALLKPSGSLLELLHSDHQRHLHATALAARPTKGRRFNRMLPAQLRKRRSRSRLLQHSKNLAVRKHRSPLEELSPTGKFYLSDPPLSGRSAGATPEINRTSNPPL